MFQAHQTSAVHRECRNAIGVRHGSDEVSPLRTGYLCNASVPSRVARLPTS
jgi:hypothetical protein